MKYDVIVCQRNVFLGIECAADCTDTELDRLYDAISEVQSVIDDLQKENDNVQQQTNT